MTELSNPTRQHYEEPSLVAKVTGILESLGDSALTAAQLAGLDQFHVGGLPATVELAQLAGIHKEMKVLDAGSGLGGPSRYLADTFGCSVVAVDLAPSFVALSQLLAERSALSHLVQYEVGDLTALSFSDGQFDVVWTQHVVMNIGDRAQVYHEFRRVLKPDGKLVFYDVYSAETKPELLFPLPWADSSETSFLLTKTETVAVLQAAHLNVSVWNDVTADALIWFAQQPPASTTALNLATVMGPRFKEMAANFARNLREGRIGIVMAVCHTL